MKIAQNARQLDVAGFICQAPCEGCAEPPWRFRRRRPQFSTAGRVGAPPPLGRGHRPWVGTAQNARQLEVAGFICQAPWRGLRRTALAVSPLEGRSFQLPAAPGPTPFGHGQRPWVEIAQNARQLEVAGFICKAPLRGLRLTAPGGFAPPKAAVFNCRPCRAQHPRPRPSSVGGNRTKRPATGSCGLHLQSPPAGAAINRPRRFRLPKAAVFNCRPSRGPTPSAAAIVRGWKSHKTPGNWTLRAPSAKPPDGGCD